MHPRLLEDHPNLKATTCLVQRHGELQMLKASARESSITRPLERPALESRPGTKRHAAWAENRGLITARTYTAKVRDLRQKEAQGKA